MTKTIFGLVVAGTTLMAANSAHASGEIDISAFLRDPARNVESLIDSYRTDSYGVGTRRGTTGNDIRAIIDSHAEEWFTLRSRTGFRNLPFSLPHLRRDR